MEPNRDRAPAVAGTFYPSDPQALRTILKSYLHNDEQHSRKLSGVLRAIIAPHAGYVYSGAIAGAAYALLRSEWQRIQRVILLGPAHRVSFRGLALSSATHFVTPLGRVPIDLHAQTQLRDLPFVSTLDVAHAEEHSLEVHLPFLQEVLGSFSFVPLLVGDADGQQVCTVLNALEPHDQSLIVVSSDLSHYLPEGDSHHLDALTARAIEDLNDSALSEDGACGRVPVLGLMAYARKHGLRARTLQLGTSADFGGGKQRVVGYGAFAFTAD